MPVKSFVSMVLAVTLAACGRAAPEPRQYELQGQILAMRPEAREVTIRHGDIRGFMPGMTMPFMVNDAALLEGKQPGDLVTATLVVGENEAHLSTLTKTGSAPIENPIEVTRTEGAILMPGDIVPDQLLVDQDGVPMPISSLRGHRVALTFMYVRCPLPDFCPRMDQNFAAVQKTIKSTPELADVRLVSVSFDPEYDTPAELKKHAQALGADPAVWKFVTATPEEMEKLTGRFGVHVERDDQKSINITHNLRTAVIGPDGRVVKVHSGTDWTPAQLVADLKAAPTPAH
jgi:protein SCO1/2